jgi:hypothetical protein
MEEKHNFLYIFYVIKYGEPTKRSSSFPRILTYPSTERWNEDKIRETIRSVGNEKRFRVYKIEEIEKVGIKPKAKNIPIPTLKPLKNF